MAPEIFLQRGYGQECDWWSLGAIMFECLCGYPPFCSENPHETYRKIMNWKESLIFPDDQPISREAEDLIRRLICEPENRLGRNGVEEIKAHPFFYGVNWQGIRDEASPHVPQLKSITDTSYFPTEELDAVPEAVDNGHHGKLFLKNMKIIHMCICKCNYIHHYILTTNHYLLFRSLTS